MTAPAKTAEALMRSRYSAYVKGAIDYLIDTVLPEQRFDLDRKSVQEWSESAEWKGLEVKNSSGGEADSKGKVEFVARFRQGGLEHTHHEIGRFKRRDGKWYYVDGKVIPTVPAGAPISRNGPCPCGSGKKFKRCCAPPLTT
jgi:SEC-C motif-containing protein